LLINGHADVIKLGEIYGIMYRLPLFPSQLALGLLSLPLASLQAAPHRYDHVVVVVEENRTVGEIIGDLTNAPYINSLAQGGVTVSSIYAIEHPSQPNYLQLFSGSNQGVLDDTLPPNFSVTPTATYPFTARNLGAELITAGFTFAGYSEELESADALVPPKDRADYDPHAPTVPVGITYRRKHNPWANWVAKVAPIPANHLPASINKSFTQFPTDFTQLPTVSFIVPNQNNDMHDGSRKEGDTWLQTNLNAYAQWAKTHNSLLIITWDEDDYNATNQIPTVLYGAALRNGTLTGGTWTLHNLLRTLEDMYGSATHAGAAADVQPIIGPFTDDPAVLVKAFRQNLNGYTSVKDTMLWQAAPTTNNAATQDLTADLDTDAATGNQVGQILVRFDSLFGSTATQVPTNATIHSAKLILNTPLNITGTDYDSDDTYRCHRMIMDWADTATWDSTVVGISANGTEAATATSFSLVPDVDGGPAIFDVTLDVQQFLAGTATNRGWFIRPSTAGTGDGWTMKSSETTTNQALRPTLELVYSVPSVNAYDTWATSRALTAANNLPGADPDHDGINNIVEYAFNLNPLTPDALPATPTGTSGLPRVVAVPSGGGQQLEITFLRRKDVASGLTYAAEFSGNLTTWQTGGTPIVSSVDATWERVTVRDTAAPTSPRRFAHVLLTLTR
jgi:hypothetical protein